MKAPSKKMAEAIRFAQKTGNVLIRWRGGLWGIKHNDPSTIQYEWFTDGTIRALLRWGWVKYVMPEPNACGHVNYGPLKITLTERGINL